MEDMNKPATKQDVYDIVQSVVDRVVRAAADDTFQVLETMMARIDERFNDNELRIAKLQTDVASLTVQMDAVHEYLDISDDSWKWTVD